MTGDEGVDENCFCDSVVDWRWKLREADGVVDEGEEAAAAATCTVPPDDRITREFRRPRAVAKFRFLNASETWRPLSAAESPRLTVLLLYHVYDSLEGLSSNI